MTQEQPSFPVHLNEATAEELRALPGIGPVRAEAIIAHREAHGPFARVEDLRHVEAIPERVYEAIRDLVTVAPKPAAEAPQAPSPEEVVEAREEISPEAEVVAEPPPPPTPEVPPRAEVAPPPPPPPPREPPAAPAPPVKAPRRARRLATDVLLVVLGALLGTALTLLILLGTNGTLLYSGRGAVARLEVQ
ncbi:MAG: ComEA family DNA-binding protein, partial [Anaerolineae bacterium]|nr:ComEA family DNA-binding protein [Anaerolineae bacterium]